VKLTVITDNHACRPELATQHGLSFWVEVGDRTLLFDTGSDASFLGNADALGIDVCHAERLMLSHGHWDHGGGVPALVEAGWRGTLVVHPEAWRRRRAVEEGLPERDIGLSWNRAGLESLGIVVEEVVAGCELFPAAWSTGSIPGDRPAPAAPGLQLLEGDSWRADDFRDEQTLVLDAPPGLVVVTGCCHRGVVNTLEAACRVAGRDDVYALIGGLHLKDEPRRRCLEIAAELRTFGVRKVWANHCTGLHPFAQLKEVLGADLVWAEAGMVFEV